MPALKIQRCGMGKSDLIGPHFEVRTSGIHEADPGHRAACSGAQRARGHFILFTLCCPMAPCLGAARHVQGGVRGFLGDAISMPPWTEPDTDLYGQWGGRGSGGE